MFFISKSFEKKTFCQRNLFPWFRERIKITLCVRTHVPIHKLQKFSLLHIHVHVHWCGTQQQVVSLPEINKDISWSDVNKDISRIYPMTVIVKFLYTCICIYIWHQVYAVYHRSVYEKVNPTVRTCVFSLFGNSWKSKLGNHFWGTCSSSSVTHVQTCIYAYDALTKCTCLCKTVPIVTTRPFPRSRKITFRERKWPRSYDYIGDGL